MLRLSVFGLGYVGSVYGNVLSNWRHDSHRCRRECMQDRHLNREILKSQYYGICW